MAVERSPASARDECAGSICGRRHPGRQRQASCVGGRRGRNGGPSRSSLPRRKRRAKQCVAKNGLRLKCLTWAVSTVARLQALAHHLGRQRGHLRNIVAEYAIRSVRYMKTFLLLL